MPRTAPFHRSSDGVVSSSLLGFWCDLYVTTFASQVKTAIGHYLSIYIFPRCLKYHRTKLQASGLDLGSNVLFDTRLGFSGTPSNLLAPSLVPCAFQSGTQATVLAVLLNPNIMHVKPKPGVWSPKDLLKMVLDEKENGPFNALIDTGALITGYDNTQVAQFVLKNDTHARFDAAVFIDRTGLRVFITKTNLEEPKPLTLCGVPLKRRFTFYDQAHTTGTDIKQHSAAKALATVGKGVIFRDHCQAVWRMRGIEKGQQVFVVIVDQVAKLIEKDLDKHGEKEFLERSASGLVIDMPTLIKWLLVNHLEAECMQHAQLATQASQNIWRRSAFHALLHTRPYGDDAAGADADSADDNGDGPSAAVATARADNWWESVDQFEDALFAARGAAGRHGDGADTDDALDTACEAAAGNVWAWGKRSGLEYKDWAERRGSPGLSERILEWPTPSAIQSLRGIDARYVARELEFVSSFALAPKAADSSEAAASSKALVSAAADTGGDGDTDAASSSDDAALQVEGAALPPSRAMLAKGDTVQVPLLGNGGVWNGRDWVVKATIEDIFAPTLGTPGAEQGDADIEDRAGGCVMLDVCHALTHEKPRWVRRVMPLLEVRW